MRQAVGGTGRRAAALTAVLLLHALVVWLLLRSPALLPLPATLAPLTLIYLPPPERTPPAPATPLAAPAPRRVLPRPDAPPPPRSAGAAGPPAVPAPGPVPPPIDWAAEQQQAASAGAKEIWKQLAQHCRDAEALHIHPPECHRYVAPEPWEPEEQRFGHAGPLPYVHLGNCVVGLGFWGCAIGKKPPPNSHVFDGMRDPDRPGPIPDNGGYQAPPEPREPLH